MMKSPYTLFRTSYVDRATGQRVQSDRWHIRFRDHLRRRQTIAGEPRQDATAVIANRILQLVECRRQAMAPDPSLQRWLDVQPQARRERLIAMEIIDPRTMRAERPLIQQLEGVKLEDGSTEYAGFVQSLEARGNSAKHVHNVRHQIRGVVESLGLVRMAELLTPGIENRIAVHLGERRSRKEITGTTLNYIIRDLKAFCRWLQQAGLLAAPAPAAGR